MGLPPRVVVNVWGSWLAAVANQRRLSLALFAILCRRGQCFLNKCKGLLLIRLPFMLDNYGV